MLQDNQILASFKIKLALIPLTKEFQIKDKELMIINSFKEITGIKDNRF